MSGPRQPRATNRLPKIVPKARLPGRCCVVAPRGREIVPSSDQLSRAAYSIGLLRLHEFLQLSFLLLQQFWSLLYNEIMNSEKRGIFSDGVIFIGLCVMCAGILLMAIKLCYNYVRNFPVRKDSEEHFKLIHFKQRISMEKGV
ncbi:unnamed protein product [Haemonchus placei]|uniref:Uncharacterized protein n=1 Tax=Haemonchus placei TaxID=6290 RepID=A0A0N4W964_HAEPC|nr:unnamed protein product [Haemonchus placei]